MATLLERPKKRVKSVIYDQVPTKRWKLGKNRSSGSWDNLSERFIFKKETTGCTSLHI